MSAHSRGSSGRSCPRGRVHVQDLPEVPVEVLETPSVHEALVVRVVRGRAARREGLVDQLVDPLPAVDAECQNRLRALRSTCRGPSWRQRARCPTRSLACGQRRRATRPSTTPSRALSGCHSPSSFSSLLMGPLRWTGPTVGNHRPEPRPLPARSRRVRLCGPAAGARRGGAGGIASDGAWRTRRRSRAGASRPSRRRPRPGRGAARSCSPG